MGWLLPRIEVHSIELHGHDGRLLQSLLNGDVLIDRDFLPLLRRTRYSLQDVWSVWEEEPLVESLVAKATLLELLLTLRS